MRMRRRIRRKMRVRMGWILIMKMKMTSFF